MEPPDVPVRLRLPLAPEMDVQADHPDSDPIWRGAVSVQVKGMDVVGEGSLTRTWTTGSDMRLIVTTDEDWSRGTLPLHPDGLLIDGREVDRWVTSGLSSPGEDPATRTFVISDLLLGDPTRSCTAVRFAVANFPSFIGAPVRHNGGSSAGRLVLDGGPWRFRLDELGREENRGTSGFAVTHAGLLTSTTDKLISVTDADEALASLSLWGSVMRGAYTSATSWVGEDITGQVHWTRHADWHLDPRSGRPGILPPGLAVSAREETIPALAKSLTRLIELLDDPDWHDIIRRAILWYATANIGQTDGDLILAQAGLELLAYATVVLGGQLTAEGFERLRAADQLQLFLKSKDVPVEVPTTLTRLAAYSRGRQAATATQVVTDFRNAIVHPPTKKSRPPAFDDAYTKIEAKTLALFLLERALMATLGYDGPIYDRASDTVIPLPRQ